MTNSVEYVVTAKDDPYVWLIEKGRPVAEFYALSRIKQLGMYQCLGSLEFYLPAEVRVKEPRRSKTEEAPPPPRVPANKIHKTHSVEFDFTDEEGQISSLAPQAQMLVKIMQEACAKHKKKVFLEGEIEKIVNALPSRIGGKQQPYKIWAFYRARLAKLGVIRKVSK